MAKCYPEGVIGYLKALTAAEQRYDGILAALKSMSRWTQVDTEIISQILSTSYQQSESGRFFSETTIRSNWLNVHIQQLSQIPRNKHLKTIDLNHWIQSEFAEQIDL